MKTNAELQAEIKNVFKWETILNAAEIGVSAKDGVVSLTGFVDSYAQKKEAENAVKRVFGVKALIEKIEVRCPNAQTKNDVEIANEVLTALKTNWSVPKDSVTAKVEDGWVTLEGALPWHFEKEAAKKAVHYLTGVKGVTNNIKIKSEIIDTIEKTDIEAAIARNWSINDNDIKVKVSGTTVTLLGTVSSWYQKEEVARIAWNSPGIWRVNNELEVAYYPALVH